MLEMIYILYFIFFFNDTATTEIYTLSLHDALPIFFQERSCREQAYLRALETLASRAMERENPSEAERHLRQAVADRKSTRLNSSHANISYAVFCLKKKKIK